MAKFETLGNVHRCKTLSLKHTPGLQPWPRLSTLLSVPPLALAVLTQVSTSEYGTARYLLFSPQRLEYVDLELVYIRMLLKKVRIS